MRKFLLVLFVGFTASVFALSGAAQRHRRARGRASARITAPPNSAHIAQELGGLQWGATRDQVIDYFRQAITARFQPQLRNKGQVEQDRLMQERDREIQQVRDSFVRFNGAANQRRWDTSFVGSEYTHNNNETMLVREDPSNGNREFFFFMNDRLWKRFQARNLPSGGRLDFATFVSSLESHDLFGSGLHHSREGSEQLESVEWQDGVTHLRVIDNSTFYNSFGLVYEERATVARLAELRRNLPTKTTSSAAARTTAGEPNVGNVEGDVNADIVDRITGKIRRSQNAAPSAAVTGGSGSSTGSTGSTGSAPSSPPPTAPSGNQGGTSDDPLRGL